MSVGIEDFEERIEQLKVGLVAVTRGDTTDFTDDEYRKTRKQLLGNPKLRDLIPDWLKISTTLLEANRVIREQADGLPGGKWANRAKIISDGLNPFINQLQQESAEFETSGELGELIGKGGFGEVYRWRHKLLEMDFAIKILIPSFPEEDGRYLERFFREARILLKMNHPNIVRVYDVGMYGRRPYIRMELLSGQDLNNILQSRGALDLREAATVALSLAQALEHAHGHGVIHRDLKPSNIFSIDDGSVRLIDFGLGAFVEGDLISRITRTGDTPAGGAFTAPELIADPRLLDPRSDIYSLGAVWFNFLTNLPPVGTSLDAQLERALGTSPEYKAIVMRTLADATVRHQSASELVKDIEALL